MRVVLFYSDVESFNYFTDQIEAELRRRLNEVFILDLRNPEGENEHSYQKFVQFAENVVDVAIAFDGIGIKEDLFIELWDLQGTIAVNILMDHPLRFHPTMQKHPKRYLQFCCDHNHVVYVKNYFADCVSNVSFLPHAGTFVDCNNIVPLGERQYDILFSGTYYKPEEQLAKINEWFEPGSAMNQFYHVMAQYLIENYTVPTEQAVLDTLEILGMQVEESSLKTIMRCAEPIDWMVRMYYREKVIATLADSGQDIWLLGRGWENHPSAGKKNVHRIADRIPFQETLAYMANAKINLNVMPWFKAGTHDRIFNILLQHSLPFTDTSEWINENYVSGKELVIYDLGNLEALPEQVENLLSDEVRMEAMIQCGYEKTRKNYTWIQCVDQIIKGISNI